jgi:hypothetical protein
MAESTKTTKGVVALFNASDDTIEMVHAILTNLGDGQRLIWCHFADLKRGIVNFEKYMRKHNPEVVMFDISPPYDENWIFYKTMRSNKIMNGRGSVLTTTNKLRLDEIIGEDSNALEIVGLKKDLDLINAAIAHETAIATAARLAA